MLKTSKMPPAVQLEWCSWSWGYSALQSCDSSMASQRRGIGTMCSPCVINRWYKQHNDTLYISRRFRERGRERGLVGPRLCGLHCPTTGRGSLVGRLCWLEMKIEMDLPVLWLLSLKYVFLFGFVFFHIHFLFRWGVAWLVPFLRQDKWGWERMGWVLRARITMSSSPALWDTAAANKVTLSSIWDSQSSRPGQRWHCEGWLQGHVHSFTLQLVKAQVLGFALQCSCVTLLSISLHFSIQDTETY